MCHSFEISYFIGIKRNRLLRKIDMGQSIVKVNFALFLARYT